MADVKELYKDQYETCCSLADDLCSKYSLAADRIFDLTTYDDYLDEVFVKTILEVCKVIIEKRKLRIHQERGFLH